jgi:hemerythrin
MSTTLTWNDRFSVGVKGIDRQHRELIARVNALFEAIAADRHGDEDEIESLVMFLKDYVHTHFACEERLMRRHAYPGYGRHLAEHERLIEELAWTDELYDRPGSEALGAARLSTFVFGWLVEHFQREDRALADYLRAPRARRGAARRDDDAERAGRGACRRQR